VPLPSAFAPLAAMPARAAVFLDFDGTLAPIVAEPAAARPLEGVPGLLAELGARFGMVAVVSGRPAGFLEAQLGRPGGVRLIGLYGLEEVGRPSGPTLEPAELDRWRPVMARLVDAAAREAPAGVALERKDVGFTLHYRGAPEREAWVRAFAERAAAADRVAIQEGRLAVELRPGIPTDKGTVVVTLGAGSRAACCFGDDLGDLAAFAALEELARAGTAIVRVAVRDDESPPAVAAAADLVVEGPEGALELLVTLLASVA
jgi:trehalose 6-phosphate phosphatase